MARKGLLVAVLVVLLAVSAAYPAYHSMSLNGAQAEAKLMMSYIHTLQTAYSSENGEYIYFDSNYGASIAGADNCVQPPPAEQLGFIIRWCHEEKASPVRYAYKVLKYEVGKKTSYLVRAESGSDSQGRSIVCIHPRDSDKWISSPGKPPTNEKTCSIWFW